MDIEDYYEGDLALFTSFPTLEDLLNLENVEDYVEYFEKLLESEDNLIVISGDEECGEWLSIQEIEVVENSNIDMKGLSYDESHIQSIYSNQLCIAHKSELDIVCSWLEAALNCKSFNWDADQAQAARESVEYLKYILGEDNE